MHAQLGPPTVLAAVLLPLLPHHTPSLLCPTFGCLACYRYVPLLISHSRCASLVLSSPTFWCARAPFHRYENDDTQQAVTRLSSMLTDMSVSGSLSRFGSSGRGGVVGGPRSAASFSADTLRNLVPKQKRARSSMPSPSPEGGHGGEPIEQIAGMLSSQSLDGVALDQSLDGQPKLSTVLEVRDSQQRSSEASNLSNSGEKWDANAFGRRPSATAALRASGSSVKK